MTLPVVSREELDEIKQEVYSMMVFCRQMKGDPKTFLDVKISHFEEHDKILYRQAFEYLLGVEEKYGPLEDL